MKTDPNFGYAYGSTNDYENIQQMSVLTVEDLMTLEDYDRNRNSFRDDILIHKKNRLVLIGPDISVSFEDRKTIMYQIQEMLRVEKIFHRNGIQDELDAYNPLIPDGTNWKATMMIQIPNIDDRRKALRRFLGIERCCWVKVGDAEKVYAIADEDMDRADQEKTAAVHFLRFQLPRSVYQIVGNGASIAIGIDHEAYNYVVDPVSTPLAESLCADLE